MGRRYTPHGQGAVSWRQSRQTMHRRLFAPALAHANEAAQTFSETNDLSVAADVERIRMELLARMNDPAWPTQRRSITMSSPT